MCLAKRMFPNPAKPVLGTPFTRPYGLLLLMLAALVAYGARSLTCGLAGCLALAASAVFRAVAEITGFKGLYHLHIIKPPTVPSNGTFCSDLFYHKVRDMSIFFCV